ncbi:HAD family hydrolase [Sulfitobacter sp. JB4-11]|uniref:HAD family hydrolase n=1 Tax=Sulfitobacter rhodophyticola TaxID=3238304 RepID=UPI0035151614
MKALFIGSISVLSDTSDMQRRCFNSAFGEAGLDWHWSEDTYRGMLASSGGKNRIAAFAEQKGVEVDVAALHARKSAFFADALRTGQLSMRPRTRALLAEARALDLPVAFVSGTLRASLDALVDGFGGAEALGIDLITSEELGLAPKPAPALYQYALDQLKLDPRDVVAIEDNRPGILAAQAAGVRCKAYPNANTAVHDFSDVEVLSDGPGGVAA